MIRSVHIKLSLDGGGNADLHTIIIITITIINIIIIIIYICNKNNTLLLCFSSIESQKVSMISFFLHFLKRLEKAFVLLPAIYWLW